MKKNIRNFFTMGDIEVPVCVMAKVRKFFLIGAIFILGGTLFSLSIHSYENIPAFIIVGAIIEIWGFVRMITISKKGYTLVNGTCHRIQYSVISNITKQIPKRFIIKDSDGKLYSVPYFKGNAQLVEGDTVNIYYSSDPSFIEIQGALASGKILGYEII